jgi:hypothetical protein
MLPVCTTVTIPGFGFSEALWVTSVLVDWSRER